ncbi:MAG: TetR/AcrR family transcriptional regulator [Sarcina sp.]
MNVKNDLRVIKTNNNIRSTFIELLNQKEFSAITIKDILDNALINRSTFYKYYTDKYNLAEKISEDFLAEFKKSVNLIFINGEDFENLLNIKEDFLEELYKSRETILGLWKIRLENIHVYDDMYEIIKENYINLVDQESKKDRDIEYESYICAASILATLKFILENERKYTVEDLAERLENFHKTFLKK